ncbi:MAG: hypothetical protein DMF44_13740 [Verrucomicrobia bacterium]|nr:MAG: hypothetical protein DMF44_13740 [Verrucomicrobiota bacterium]
MRVHPGSARGSRAGFGVARKQSFFKRGIHCRAQARQKFVIARTRSPARGPRALPGTKLDKLSASVA